MTYAPPFTLTQPMVDLTFRIGELVSRMEGYEALDPSPRLRKRNRIRSIHSSCAIEANSLTLEQVSDIINGHRVIGPEDEIKEVKNAVAAYSLLGSFDPYDIGELLRLHGVMMEGLADDAGKFRTGGEGVFRGRDLIFMAPPPELVPEHMRNLFDWLSSGSASINPLIASCVFHYEMVFVHPFSNGNGRMARLWQTAILGRWKGVFHWIPLENRIEKAQQEYYDAIDACNRAGDSARFVEFMLRMILSALEDADYEIRNEPRGGDKLDRLLDKMESGVYYSRPELMEMMSAKSQPSFHRDYLGPGLERGVIHMEYPQTPRSRRQRYRRSDFRPIPDSRGTPRTMAVAI